MLQQETSSLAQSDLSVNVEVHGHINVLDIQHSCSVVVLPGGSQSRHVQ